MIRKLSAILLALVWLSSCSEEEFDRIDMGDGKVNLQLNINIDGMSTRSGDYYFEDPNSKYESINSLRVIVVANTQNEEGLDAKIVEVNDVYPSLGGLNFFQKSYRVSPDNVKNVYILANIDETNLIMPSGMHQFDQWEVGHILHDNVMETKIQSDLETGRIRDNEAKVNADLPGDYVPMSEVFDVEVGPLRPEGAVYTPYTADLFLTRAVCKFSFYIDDSTDLSSDLVIKKLTISRLNDIEYLFPTQTVYQPGKYEPSTDRGRTIESFAVPAEAQSYEREIYPSDFSRVEKIKGSGQFVTTNFTPGIYFPETDAQNGGFLLSVDAEIEGRPIHYSSRVFPNLPSLPRNTHVRVNMKFSGVYMELKTEVVDWEKDDDETWDYTDNVAINYTQKLRWEEGSYAFDDQESSELLLDPNLTAVGRFTLESPKNQNWYAYLITTEGDPDAFTFVDESGNPVGKMIIGTITGNESVLRVRATKKQAVENNEAMLRVMVKIINGTEERWVEADICTNNKNYTIIQNKTQL